MLLKAIFSLVAVNFALLFYLMDRKHLLSLHNYVIFFVVGYSGARYMLYFLTNKEHVFVPYLYYSSLISLVSLLLFMLGFIVLEVGLKKINLANFSSILVGKDIAHSLNSLLLSRIFEIILVGFSVLGCLVIIAVFARAGSIPLFDPLADKYFTHYQDKYLPLRPLYVAAQQTLVVVNILLLIRLITLNDLKARIRSFLLYAANFLVLALTLKRGEMVSPLFIVFLSLLLLPRKRGQEKRLCFLLGAMLVITLLLCFLLDPSLVKNLKLNFVKQHAASSVNRQNIYRSHDCDQKKAGKDNTEHKISSAHTVGKNKPRVDLPQTPKTSVKIANGKKLAPKKQGVIVDEIQKVVLRFKRIFLRRFLDEVVDSARLMRNFEKMRCNGQINFFWGKTFLASLLGFLPTQFFDFKEKYLTTRVILRIYGLSPDCSGGPAVNLANEIYINWGYVGLVLVLFVGMLWAFLKHLYIGLFLESNHLLLDRAYYFLLHTIFVIIVGGFIISFMRNGSMAWQESIRRLLVLAVILGFSYFWFFKLRLLAGERG